MMSANLSNDQEICPDPPTQIIQERLLLLPAHRSVLELNSLKAMHGPHRRLDLRLDWPPFDKLSSWTTVFDIGPRLSEVNAVSREILLGFWKVHILHHAGEQPVHGQWILTELRRHGYDLSPGTLYPLLNRMARLGWLHCRQDADGGRRARKDYRLTARGRAVLAGVREQIRELHHEVVLGEHQHHHDQTAGKPRRRRTGTGKPRQ